jgi:signal transduction histidine kinase
LFFFTGPPQRALERVKPKPPGCQSAGGLICWALVQERIHRVSFLVKKLPPSGKLLAIDMNSAARLRMTILIGAIALMAGLTLWGVQDSWRRITQLERKLTASQLGSFRLAGEFQQRLLTLDNLLLRYIARRNPATWNQFQEDSVQLDQWIDQQTSKLTTPRELDLFHQLDTAYDEYLDAAAQVHTNRQPAGITAEAFAQLEHAESHGDRLHQLSIQLAGAHLEAEGLFLTDANRTLANLRVFLFIGVVLLLALVAVLGVVLYRDLIAPLRTKLVQSEVLLEKQEKLATLGTLAAGIAHEIRNPLTSIKARLYMLGKRVATDAASMADTGVISSEIGRLERIVQDVLHFARPSEPQLKIVRADVPLREVASLIGSTLEHGRVQLALEGGPELHVSMDTALIKQVLINLVRNAAEAIEDQGSVTLRVRASHAKLHGKSSDVAVLEVTDTGKGIPHEVEKRLFDPFFTTKEAGTGLGLSIAARIVEKQGGALEYQTRPGHGTTFGIMLPAVPAPATDSSIPPA